MIEQKQLSCDSVWDRLPPLSSRYVWLASHVFESGMQIFYNLDNPLSHYRCRIPELLGRRIRATFHGWVILSSYPRVVMWSLWNPLTSKLIRLPPLNHEHGDSHVCCLSAPVDDPTAIFLLTTNEKPTIVFCRLDRKRKRLKWTEMSYANQVKSMSYVDQVCLLECPTCCNGKVYALTRGAYEQSIVQIDIVLKEKEVVITLLPFYEVPFSFDRTPPFNRGSCFLPFLKGTCTELFYILVQFKDETSTTVCDVFLSRFDMTSMRWEEIQDLKDAIFFIELVSDYSVFYKLAVASELGGCVHILGEMGKVIYSYHLKNRTISPISMPCVVRENQAWTMLEFSTKGDHVDSKQREEDKDIDIDVRLVERDYEIVANSTTIVELPMLDISCHLLEKIMEHCVGVEYLNFRTTCKYFHIAAPSIQWSNIATLKRLQMYSLVSPLLMVMDKEGVITFIDSMGSDRYLLRTSWEPIAHHHIYCFRYGWLLMYNGGSGSTVFFNPFTNALCKLPMTFCIDRFCLSAAPTSLDYHFVAQKQSWRRFTLNFGGDDPHSCQFLTFYGCDLYALSDEGGIGVFRQRGKVIYSDLINDRTISPYSTPCVVRESQAWAMLECRLVGDHADDSKQREEDRDDNGIDSRLIRDDDENIASNSTTGEYSPLLDISFHLLEKIMEHCLGVEYMNFRSTCKQCHLAAPPIKWRTNKTALRRLQMYSLVSPWLMVLDNEGVITFIDPMGGDRYFLTTSRELIADHHIYCSRYGWLLMYKLGSGSPVFFNPFTNVICKLPRILRIGMFCFSAPPTSPDCMVVGFTTCEEWEVYIHFVAQEQSWRRFTLKFGGNDPYSFQFPTFYGHDLYALSNEGGISVFRQMGEEDYSLEHLVSKAPTSCRSSVQYFLANCDQHILLVILGEFGESVEVFNLNDSKSEWEKMDGLGKHMVYISDTTCLCIKAKLPEMENKIYFSRLLHTGNGKVVFYSLETCRFHTFHGKNIEEGFEDLFRTIYYCNPHTWIEPSWLFI